MPSLIVSILKLAAKAGLLVVLALGAPTCAWAADSSVVTYTCEMNDYTPRNPLFSATMSALLPGGGQFYNQQPSKGLLVASAEAVGALWLIMDIMGHNTELSPASWLLPIGYGVSILDAGWSASAFNERMAAAGCNPISPPPPDSRLSVGVKSMVGNNEMSGILGEVEYRLLPAIGASIAYSANAGSSGTDTTTMYNLRWYLNPSNPHQLYIGYEYGIQERSNSSQYNFKYLYRGATAGLALKATNMPWELRASFGLGSCEGVAGYYTTTRYGRWAGGLSVAF